MPIGNPTSPSFINSLVPTREATPSRVRTAAGLRRPLSKLAIWGVATLAPVLPAAAIAADAPATAAVGGELTAPERRDQILESAATFARGTTPLSALGKAACERQKELDARSFTTCEYPGAFAAAKKRYPRMVRNRAISRPGTEDKADRKRLYWIAYPGEYQLMRKETEAGMYYVSPRPNLQYRVGFRETGNRLDAVSYSPKGLYRGKYQMDPGFENTYNYAAVQLWGRADEWPAGAQDLAFDRAYEGFAGHAARGVGPWPPSVREEPSLFPCPISAQASIKARC